MSPPQQIGRYRVERRLGSGAFAVVWLAHDDRLEAPVAIKVLADNWATRLDIRERFLSEARLLRQAGSGGVVQVFDVGELPDERPYFVMEYADAGTVEDLLTAGPLPLPEALRIASGAAAGVASLHAAGIAHRDIKPSNVLLKNAGSAVRRARPGSERVLLADLGLAKNLAQASGLTVVAGSTGYMAPEQSDPPPDGIDVRVDVYGLGALLHHLLTGTVPGPAGRVLPPQDLLPGIPEAVGAVVMRAMAPDREDRWSSATEFARALERAAGAQPEPAPTPAPAPAPTSAAAPAPAAAPTSAAAPAPAPAPASTSAQSPAPAPTRTLLPTAAPVPAATPPPIPPPGRRRRALTATAVVLVLAAGGAAVALREGGGGGGGDGTGGMRKVADRTGSVTLPVPEDWARETANGGWDPSALGLPAGEAAGLTVAQDVKNWSDLDKRVEGVFAGRVAAKAAGAKGSTLTRAVGDVRHDSCGSARQREFSDAHWSGRVRTWDNCGEGELSEVALVPRTSGADAAYVQIRCAEGAKDCETVTDRLLRGLRIGAQGKSSGKS